MSQLILIRTNVRIKYTQYAKLCWLLLWHCKLQALRSSYSGNLSPNILGRLILQEEVPPTHSSEAIHFGHTKPDALKWSLFENHEIWAPHSVLRFLLWFIFSVHKKIKTNKKPIIKQTLFITLSALQIPVDIGSSSSTKKHQPYTKRETTKQFSIIPLRNS